MSYVIAITRSIGTSFLTAAIRAPIPAKSYTVHSETLPFCLHSALEKDNVFFTWETVLLSVCGMSVRADYLRKEELYQYVTSDL